MLRGALRAARAWRVVAAGAAERGFLTEAYRCETAWAARATSPLLRAVQLEELYAALEQAHASRGAISALDLDVFANAANGEYLDELRDLLHKLRLAADTGRTLPSTPHAAVRAFLRHERTDDLLAMLADPVNYGIFLDHFAANILMDDLLNGEQYEKAATVAGLVMLQEDYSNDITRALSLYSAYSYLRLRREVPAPVIPEPEEPKGKEKVEEIKIRVKYLRNPYFDDHFDLKDPVLRAGKTLAWMSESGTDNLSLNVQILGWLFYKKYDKLLVVSQALAKSSSPKIYKEVLEILKDTTISEEATQSIEECALALCNIPVSESLLQNDLKILIENAINKRQKNDILEQEKLFKSWEQLRDEKFAEQTKRLDEARRVQMLEEKQKYLTAEEQKLWFFENEEKLDLAIEKKKVYYPKKWFGKKKKPRVVDEGYIPPEIVPKRK